MGRVFAHPSGLPVASRLSRGLPALAAVAIVDTIVARLAEGGDRHVAALVHEQAAVGVHLGDLGVTVGGLDHDPLDGVVGRRHEAQHDLKVAHRALSVHLRLHGAEAELGSHVLRALPGLEAVQEVDVCPADLGVVVLGLGRGPLRFVGRNGREEGEGRAFWELDFAVELVHDEGLLEQRLLAGAAGGNALDELGGETGDEELETGVSVHENS